MKDSIKGAIIHCFSPKTLKPKHKLYIHHYQSVLLCSIDLRKLSKGVSTENQWV